MAPPGSQATTIGSDLGNDGWRGFIQTTSSTAASSTSPEETRVPGIGDNDDDDSLRAEGGGRGGGLSTGAKAGVGVGAALAVILILGLILFVMRRRRRGRKVAGGYMTPIRSERELREKEAAVGVVSRSTSGSTTNLGPGTEGSAVQPDGLTRGGSYHTGDDHRPDLGGAGAVGRKPVGAASEEVESWRESRANAPTATVQSDEERLRWEEEERRLDADIAEAERRRTEE